MIQFIDQVKQYKEGAQSVSILSKQTDLYYSEKYYIKGKGGKETFTNSFIPGKIYVGEYLTKTTLSPTVKYINRYPTFFFISRKKIGNDVIIKGIDLNVIPPDYRGMILLKIYDQFFDIISANNNANESEQIPIILNSDRLSALLSDTGYKKAITGFKREYLGNIKIVDYFDWCKLPYLNNATIQGISLNAIYTNYRSKLKS